MSLLQPLDMYQTQLRLPNLQVKFCQKISQLHRKYDPNTCYAQFPYSREYASIEWTDDEGFMESPPRLGLGAMYMPLTKGLIYQSLCPVLRYKDGKVLDTKLCMTHGLATTNCVLYPNSIKWSSNTLSYTYTNILILP